MALRTGSARVLGLGRACLCSVGKTAVRNFSSHAVSARPALARAAAVPARGLATFAKRERTFICIKPDGVQRGVIGEVISRFERKGFKLVAMKMMIADKEHLRKHYCDLSSKGFFEDLVTYMNSAPVVGMVWEGENMVTCGRTLLGATNPVQSAPGTIRGDFGLNVGRNVCHGSDSVENANKEIAMWFKPEELLEWESHSDAWVHEFPAK